MKTLLLAVLLLPMFALGSDISAQTAPPTRDQFKRSLVALHKQTQEWLVILDEVQIEQMPVGYAQGKLIEQAKSQATQWVNTVAIANQKAIESDSLAIEIDLSYMLDETGHGILDLSTLLNEIDLPKGKNFEKRNQWSKDLTDLALGPVDTICQSSLAFVMERADEMQRGKQ